MVRSSDNSPEGSRLDSQHPRGSSLPVLTLASGGSDASSSGLHNHQGNDIQTYVDKDPYTQNKIKINSGK